jgi:hypothetical protein
MTEEKQAEIAWEICKFISKIECILWDEYDYLFGHLSEKDRCTDDLVLPEYDPDENENTPVNVNMEKVLANIGQTIGVASLQNKSEEEPSCSLSAYKP